VSSGHARASLQLAVVFALASGLFTVRAQATTEDSSELFERGQRALEHGDLAQAEAAFRRVLAIHAADAGAHGNLGVIAMRRKQWKSALNELQSAEKLAPDNLGIRLNIGLVYFRQSDFQSAIPPFEFVLHQDPGSAQARHLLGLCYFFGERYGDAVSALEPLWPEESETLEYLYVVAVAAARSGRADLHERALKRMVEVGNDSAELHLFMGKSYLQHLDNDRATDELELAAKIDPKLPFVHYFLGVAYRRRHDLERAKAEFQKDMEIEPDVAFDYDQLGAVCTDLEQYPDALRFFQQALRLDSHLASSEFGLGKIYKEQGKYPEALGALDAAGRLDPASSSVHYLKGQILVRLGRRAEGRAELETAERMKQAATDKFEREVSGASFLDPQLAADSAK
jgi:tetratricopeptide (TPR) repeat protein